MLEQCSRRSLGDWLGGYTDHADGAEAPAQIGVLRSEKEAGAVSKERARSAIRCGICLCSAIRAAPHVPRRADPALLTSRAGFNPLPQPGAQNLSKLNVAAALEKGRAERAERCALSADMVVDELQAGGIRMRSEAGAALGTETGSDGRQIGRDPRWWSTSCARSALRTWPTT
jgi:hypothetical protein